MFGQAAGPARKGTTGMCRCFALRTMIVLTQILDIESVMKGDHHVEIASSPIKHVKDTTLD